MRLDEYLKKEGLTQAVFAKKIRVTQPSVSDWCKGSPPKRKNALKIVSITSGKVTLNDLWNIKDV